MNIRRRLTFRFVFHFVGLLFIIITFLLVLLIYLAGELMSAERESDFTRVSVGYLEYGIEIEDSEAYIKGEIRESVLAKDGWLQVIDEEGVVIGSVNTPNDVPVSYRFIDLVTLDLENYKTHHWSVKLPSGEQVSVLYGETHKSKRILNVLKNKETFPTITNEDNDYLQQQHAWMHVYNAKGEKIQQFGLTKDATYTFNDILSAEKEPWNSPVQLSTSYIEREELLYVVGIDNIKYSPDDVMDVHIGMNMLKAILVAIMLLILLIASLAFWYGKKFGIPILHIMRWVNNMSEGKLEEPRNKKGKKPLLNKRNVLHKRYRVFKGVLVSLESLGDTLKRNAEEQKKIEKTREEWITGLSHDLKTPLSSIYGYATLLETDAYTWSKEETMEFGHIMKEKSAYMSELIDDLTLTYRLKNNGLPLQKEKREVVSLLRELVKSYCMADNLVQLQCTQEEVFLDIDVKWFTRMMNNLLANAREHNPSDTEITVVVEQRRTSTAILVKDNGVGMDTETIDKLFNRYYRGGTTTDSSDGSGLGMAIAHQLVQAHGGEVQVMSQKGVGTVIKLLFPTNTDTNRNNG